MSLQAMTRIRVGGVPEHFNIPWHNAIDEGVFADHDLDVCFKSYPGGTGAMTAALRANELDVAVLLFEGAVTNILRGNQHRIVKVYVQSPLIWGIHVSAHSDIDRVEEIRDRVYAISRKGSGSHLIAIVDAAERGWSTQTMKFSLVGDLAGARKQLADRTADVFLWERFITQPFVDAGEFRRVAQRIVPWPAFVVSVRQAFLQENAAAIYQMLELLQAACKDFKSDPDAISIVSERYDIKPTDSRRWFEHVSWSDNFECPHDTIAKIIGYLNQVEIIDIPSVSSTDVWLDLR